MDMRGKALIINGRMVPSGGGTLTPEEQEFIDLQNKVYERAEEIQSRAEEARRKEEKDYIQWCLHNRRAIEAMARLIGEFKKKPDWANGSWHETFRQNGTEPNSRKSRKL